MSSKPSTETINIFGKIKTRKLSVKAKEMNKSKFVQQQIVTFAYQFTGRYKHRLGKT